jgi:hypothetical protein
MSQASVDDIEILDAYSRAVVSVVEAVGPAVVSITMGRSGAGGRVGATGAGSGVIIAPDGYVLPTTTSFTMPVASRRR